MRKLGRITRSKSYKIHVSLCEGCSVLNVKALVGAFNQEKVLVGAFSVIVKTDCDPEGSFYSINTNTRRNACSPSSGQEKNSPTLL